MSAAVSAWREVPPLDDLAVRLFFALTLLVPLTQLTVGVRHIARVRKEQRSATHTRTQRTQGNGEGEVHPTLAEQRVGTPSRTGSSLIQVAPIAQRPKPLETTSGWTNHNNSGSNSISGTEEHVAVSVVSVSAWAPPAAEPAASTTWLSWWLHAPVAQAILSVLTGLVGCALCIYSVVRGGAASINTDKATLQLSSIYLLLVGASRLQLQHQVVRLGIMVSRGVQSQCASTLQQRQRYVSYFSMFSHTALLLNGGVFIACTSGMILMHEYPDQRQTAAWIIAVSIWISTLMGPFSSYVIVTRILRALQAHAATTFGIAASPFAASFLTRPPSLTPSDTSVAAGLASPAPQPTLSTCSFSSPSRPGLVLSPRSFSVGMGASQAAELILGDEGVERATLPAAVQMQRQAKQNAAVSRAQVQKHSRRPMQFFKRVAHKYTVASPSSPCTDRPSSQVRRTPSISLVSTGRVGGMLDDRDFHDHLTRPHSVGSAAAAVSATTVIITAAAAAPVPTPRQHARTPRSPLVPQMHLRQLVAAGGSTASTLSVYTDRDTSRSYLAVDAVQSILSPIARPLSGGATGVSCPPSPMLGTVSVSKRTQGKMLPLPASSSLPASPLHAQVQARPPAHRTPSQSFQGSRAFNQQADTTIAPIPLSIRSPSSSRLRRAPLPPLPTPVGHVAEARDGAAGVTAVATQARVQSGSLSSFAARSTRSQSPPPPPLSHSLSARLSAHRVQVLMWQSKMTRLKNYLLPTLLTAALAACIATVPWFTAHFTFTLQMCLIATSVCVLTAIRELPIHINDNMTTAMQQQEHTAVMTTQVH